jgi:hypothetical protein
MRSGAKYMVGRLEKMGVHVYTEVSSATWYLQHLDKID